MADASTTKRPGEVDGLGAAAVLGRTRPLLDVLTAQLADVVDGTEEAALAVMSGVRDVDVELEALAALADELVRQSEDGASRMASATRANAERFDELVRIVSERDCAVLELVGRVRELDAQVDAASALARATTVLALDAEAEAVRAGGTGHRFRVIAEEVRELSLQSSRAAGSLRAGIDRVTTRVEGGPHRAGRSAAAAASSCGDDRLEAIARAQREASDVLGASVLGTRDVAGRMAASVAALGARATAVLAEAQFQDVTRQTVESVVASMRMLGDHLAAVSRHLEGQADAASLAELDDAMSSLASSYVSQRQRAVHARLTGEPDVAEADAIELF